MQILNISLSFVQYPYKECKFNVFYSERSYYINPISVINIVVVLFFIYWIIFIMAMFEFYLLYTKIVYNKIIKQQLINNNCWNYYFTLVVFFLFYFFLGNFEKNIQFPYLGGIKLNHANYSRWFWLRSLIFNLLKGCVWYLDRIDKRWFKRK